jgi:hypothetical protein
MRRTQQVVLALVVTCLGIGAVGDASAAQQAESTIRVTRATGDTEHVEVHGKVASGSDRCLRNRRVSVYHDTLPEGPDPEDYKIGKTRTEDNGKWDVASVALPDKVYARVHANRHCKNDVSPTVAVTSG